MTDRLLIDFTEQQLQNYYRQFSKAELIKMLAAHAEEQSAPVYPTSVPEIGPYTPAGRPDKGTAAERRAKLVYLVQQAYPNAPDLTSLAKATGMSKRTLLNLQSDDAFLTALGPFAAFYKGLTPVTRSRLSYAWRVVLDLHNYQLCQQYPGQRLPLYQLHATLFGAIPTTGAVVITSRDVKERDRLLTGHLPSLLQQAGWDPLPEPDQRGPDATELEPNGCPLIRAHFDKAMIEHTSTARNLLGPAPWLEAKHAWLTGNYLTVMAQLLGLA